MRQVPMSLITYKDVRPWPKTIKASTLIRDKQGVMPPWFVEKDFGIQQFKNDPSLRDMDLAKIAKRADSISAAVQAEFQTWMKSLQTQVTAVRGGIVAKNNATVSAEAGKLAEVFERVNAFWQKQHNDDALQFSD